MGACSLVSGTVNLTGLSRKLGGGGRNALNLRSILGDHCSWKKMVEKAAVVVGLAGPSSLHFPIPSAWHITRP